MAVQESGGGAKVRRRSTLILEASPTVSKYSLADPGDELPKPRRNFGLVQGSNQKITDRVELQTRKNSKDQDSNRVM